MSNATLVTGAVEHSPDILISEDLDEETDLLIIACKRHVQGLLRTRGLNDWKDFSKPEREEIALKMAQEIVFKDETFSNPVWSAKADWFFNGVTVYVKCYEEYPTNLNEAYIQRWYNTCYFDGHTGRLQSIDKIMGWP